MSNTPNKLSPLSLICACIKRIPLPVLALMALQLVIYPHIFIWLITIVSFATISFAGFRIYKFRKDKKLANQQISENNKYAIEIHAPINGLVIGENADVNQNYNHKNW